MTGGPDAPGGSGSGLPGLHGRAELRRRVGDMAAVAGVRQVVLADGTERGLRVLEFRTGSGLRFEVVVDRGMDLGAAEHGGSSFGWCSPTGLRHPGLHEFNDEDGFSWLRSFSGLLVTGGLDHILAPAVRDAGTYRYPPRPSVRHPLHGRVANTPARLVGSGARWQGERYVLWAEGEVRQAAVFGENLLLRRRIEADAFGDEIRLTDEVVNEGYDPTPHRVLYHLNFGWPLLDEGTRLVADLAGTPWRSASCDAQGTPYDVFPGPRPGFVEEVRHHVPRPGPDGRARAALVNDRLGFAVEVAWHTAELPHLLQWSHLREGGYAVGLEPATHHPASPDGDAAADPAGWLAPGESRNYRLTLTVTPPRRGAGTPAG